MKRLIITVWILVCFALTPLQADILHIADYLGSRVLRVTTSGTILRSSKVELPFYLTVDSAGNAYASDGGGKLFRVSTGGKVKALRYKQPTFLDSYGAVATDQEGFLYVVNNGYSTLEKFSPSGIYLGEASFTGIQQAAAMTSDIQGNVYAANYSDIHKFGPGGIDLGSPVTSVFQTRCLTIDPAGNFYRIASGSGTIQKYTANGNYVGVFAVPAGETMGICADKNGEIYSVASTGLVQKFAANGTLLNSFVVPGISMAAAIGVSTSYEEFSGNYTGVCDDSSGGVQLTLTKTGAFTGKISQVASKPLSFRGQLNSQGHFSGVFGPIEIPVYLSLQGNSNPLLLQGIVGESSFSAYQQTYGKGMAVVEEGAYTMIIGDAWDFSSSLPGYGFSKLNVSTKGIVKMVGKLADGTGVTCSSPVTGSAEGPLQFVFANTTLYKHQGGIVGSSYFYGLPDSDLLGSLQWVKYVAKGPLADSFSANISYRGARFSKTGRSETVLPFTKFIMRISGADLPSFLVVTGELTSQGKLLIEGDNPNQIKASISKTGLWSGTFLHISSGKKVKFQGMAYQHPGFPWGAGYFITPVSGGISEIGEVSIIPE